MKLEKGLIQLRECYIFAHLTYCILSASYLMGWVKTIQLSQSNTQLRILWLACMIAVLALIPIQHRIITKTFYRVEQGLLWDKIIYSFTICAVYLPIVQVLPGGAGTGILVIVPVILNSIICGTVYGIGTSLVISVWILTSQISAIITSPELLTSYIINLLLLISTAWFVGQSFQYIKKLFYNLVENERHRNDLLDNLGVATLYIDNSGDVVFCNKRFIDLFGSAQFNKINVRDIIEKHLPFIHIDSNITKGQLAGFLLKIPPAFGQAVDQRGKQLPVQCFTHPVSSGLDGKNDIVICVHDISLSKTLETERARSNYFFDFFNTGLIVTDSSGKIIEANPRAEALLNINKDNILNDNLGNFISRLTGYQASFALQQSANYEVEIESRTILLHCTELSGTTRDRLGGLCIVDDITENKDMERKVQRSATLSAIGELAAGTAHEIRNPLTSIRGFLQLLQEKKEARIGDYNNYFTIMLREVDRINSITTEFLKLARTEKPVLNRVSLTGITNSIWELLQSDALLKDITLVRELDPHIPPIMGNDDLIKQAIINLAQNALQFTSRGGTVKVTVSKNNRNVVLTVADNGSGIDQSILPRIFDPFFTTRAEGTGLGLAITSKIVNDLDGTIRVTSRPGQGTSFSIKFPVADPNYTSSPRPGAGDRPDPVTAGPANPQAPTETKRPAPVRAQFP
ncbi:signal transduction histidine kinase [Desulfallas thermosapovorans DSM 6562]|uniref:histidine kinase n=1 Tax=Desulfallas thermosapovorans DSM 6562 TaxID=1121431 RepID=A0A5S4ZWR1_9FIRM|nr:signal transduction histidine kinase [Desulfallas thermosapovorans DSM 6562]